MPVNNESINNGGVCRTAPATPGLLITPYIDNLKNTTGDKRFTFLNTDQNPLTNIRSVIILHCMRKLLFEMILDIGICPNKKTQEIESPGFLV